MSPIRRAEVTAALAGLLALGSAGQARADHRTEVEIETLNASLYDDYGRLGLEISYDVELENFVTGENFDLRLIVTEEGMPLRDARGQELEIVLPLNDPTEVDDGELTFERTLTIPLSDCNIRNPDNVRVYGQVIRAGDGQVFDAEETHASFLQPAPPVVSETSVSIGLGFWGGSPSPVVCDTGPIVYAPTHVRPAPYCGPTAIRRTSVIRETRSSGHSWFGRRDSGHRSDFGRREGSGHRPDFNRRPDTNRRPDSNRGPEFGRRPQNNRGPDINRGSDFGRRPQDNRAPQVGRRPENNRGTEFGRRPENNRRPQMGSRPQSASRPQFGSRPDSNRRPEMGNRPSTGQRRELGNRPGTSRGAELARGRDTNRRTESGRGSSNRRSSRGR